MASLKWTIGTGHSEERTFRQTPKDKKHPQGSRGNSPCTGPETGRSLICVRRNRKKARPVTGWRKRVSGRR